jgi:hypothetical protein
LNRVTMRADYGKVHGEATANDLVQTVHPVISSAGAFRRREKSRFKR